MSETTPSPEPGRDDTPPTPEWFASVEPASVSAAEGMTGDADPVAATAAPVLPTPAAAETTALSTSGGASTMVFPPVTSYPPPVTTGPT
ncbi:MAG: hypothetical protein WAW82_06880, partial [Candidatus Lutibacillus vidarii]